MSDIELFNQAIARYKTATCKNGFNFDKVISFLENEIQQYRETIKNLESYIEDLNHKNEILSYGVEKTQLEAVQENTTAGEIIKALSENGYNTITINCYKDIESEG